MAQRTITVMTDDIEGKESEDVQTYSFAVNGTQYEIDLNDKNAKKFNEAIGFYTDHGRKVGKASSKATGAARKSGRSDLAEIREWAKANGHTTSDRGRIAQEIIDAYDAAKK